MKHRINVRSLRKLANHLLTGKLGHKKFNFSVWNSDKNEYGSSIAPESPDGCGTNGCAIGELPFVFPKQFRFEGEVVFNKKTQKKITSLTNNELFGLNEKEFDHLFLPDSQIREWSKNKRNHYLTGKSTRKRVGENILYFCELVGQDKIITPECYN